MTPSEHLPTVRADYDTMAQAYTAFIGDAFDHKVSPAWRYSADHVIRLLGQNGVDEVARLMVPPHEDPVRGFPQAHLLARKART